MVKVATIINTHGLKGECKLYLFTDDAKHRFKHGRVLYLDKEKELKVISYREQKGFGYCKFEGVDTIEKAESLKTHELYLKKEDLPRLENGQYYYHELMDCTVLNETGETLGVVSDILETGANLVLRVSKDTSNFLLPFVEAFVVDVNVTKKQIVIKEMEGLR